MTSSSGVKRPVPPRPQSNRFGVPPLGGLHRHPSSSPLPRLGAAHPPYLIAHRGAARINSRAGTNGTRMAYPFGCRFVMRGNFYKRRASLLWLAIALLFSPGTALAADLSARFDTEIVPILNKYCLDCHSAEIQKGDLDLERFRTLSDTRRHPKIWQQVLEQLSNGEMP